MAHLRPIGPNIWVIERPHRMMGMQIGTRSTLVRRHDGTLVLLSPGEFSDEIWQEIDALGSVRMLIAPNGFHHLFLRDAAARNPEAKVYLAKGLVSKVGTLAHAHDIDETSIALLSPALHAVCLAGTTTQETVFWHPESRTLILTDMVFNLREGGWWTRFLMSFNGGFQRFGPTKLFLSTIDDKQAFDQSLTQILAWDFDQIVMAHGAIVAHGGRPLLRDAFA